MPKYWVVLIALLFLIGLSTQAFIPAQTNRSNAPLADTPTDTPSIPGTDTPTDTLIPPSPTPTLADTNTPTGTDTQTPTVPATATSIPPTPVPTSTPTKTIAPTVTPTKTRTLTPLPPTATLAVTPTLAPGGDLAIVIANLPTPIQPGVTLIYQMTLSNNGSVDTNNVDVAGTLSAQVVYTGSSCANVTINGNLVTCHFAGVAVGSSSQFNIQVSVKPAAAGDIPFRAVVSSNTLDPQAANNSAQVNTTIDSTKPTVVWVAPTIDGKSLILDGSLVHLMVNASDNIAIARVRFYRWDKISLRFADITNLNSLPYQINLDTHILSFGWNEIDTEAYDTAGNVSDHQFIFLYQNAYQYLPFVR